MYMPQSIKSGEKSVGLSFEDISDDPRWLTRRTLKSNGCNGKKYLTRCGVFFQFDDDGDGLIRLKDLPRQLDDFVDGEIPIHRRDLILDMADVDKDRIINYKEFVKMVSNTNNQRGSSHFHKLVRVAASSVVPRSLRRRVVEEYGDLYSCRPPPLFILTASLAELGVFIYYAVLLGNVGFTTPIQIKSPLIYNPYRRKEAWRFISYMFLHAGILHIFNNLLVQLLLGIPLEMVHKWYRVAPVYLAGVLAGCLATTVVDPKVYVVGASGGVYALIAAHLANIIMNFKEMEFAVFRLAAIIAFAFSDIGYFIYNRYWNPGLGPKVGYISHLAGAVSGLLIGIAILRNVDSKPWEERIWWISLLIYILLLIFGIAWNIFYPGFPEQEI